MKASELVSEILSPEETIRLFGIVQFLCAAENNVRALALMLRAIAERRDLTDLDRDLTAASSFADQAVTLYSRAVDEVSQAIKQRGKPEAESARHLH